MVPPTIHASAVLIGARAVLIRGPSGTGKSRLALGLLQAAQAGLLPFCRLVADDRATIEPHNGRLLVRPAPTLAGLLEVRGVGIRRCEFEAVAVVGLLIDLGAGDADRLPPASALTRVVAGITLPRQAVAPGTDPLPLTLALVHTLRHAT
jgi:HPr kinase/phosphorylase